MHSIFTIILTSTLLSDCPFSILNCNDGSSVFKMLSVHSKFICAKCDKGFTRKHNLKSHIFKTCPESNYVKPRAPGVQILDFKTDAEFFIWKNEEEQRSCSKFSQNNGSWKTKRSGKVLTKYVCHRAGYVRVKDQSVRKRCLKIKGSCKINNHCTAFILAVKHRDGTITAQYNQKHCNHPIEMKYLPLSKCDKVEFANKLEEGVPMERILDDVRDTLSDSQPITRKHMVTREELRNIKRDFNIVFKERSCYVDTVSVELLVEQYEKKYGTESPFLYYKQQGVEHDTFKKEDLLLVIMNSTQVNFLQKFGPDKICIDSTHCTTENDFILNTILVVDDFNLVVPAAHLISNHEDTKFLKKFFEVVKEKCGTITTKTFMSDDYPAYINAWEEVMGSVENRLLCTWHVDRNWRKNLTRIKEVDRIKKGEDLKQLSVYVAELKKQVYKAVRTIMEQTDPNLFPKIVDSLIEKLENEPAAKDFGAYFKKEYSDRYKMWAFAFRKHVGINMNMKIEAMHREIKNLYFKGTKDKRLDFLIITLLRMNRNKAHARITKLLMETDTHTLRPIRQCHQESLKIPKEDIVLINEETAIIRSQSNRSMCYTISKEVDHCDCQLRCADCDSICVHMYLCTCMDNTITHNMCKHIHAFMNVLSSKEVYSNDTINVEMSTDISEGEKYEEIQGIRNRVQSQPIEHLNSEENIGKSLRSIVHQLTLSVKNIGDGIGNDTERKALQCLKQGLKFLQMNEKDVEIPKNQI